MTDEVWIVCGEPYNSGRDFIWVFTDEKMAREKALEMNRIQIRCVLNDNHRKIELYLRPTQCSGMYGLWFNHDGHRRNWERAMNRLLEMLETEDYQEEYVAGFSPFYVTRVSVETAFDRWYGKHTAEDTVLKSFRFKGMKTKEEYVKSKEAKHYLRLDE